MFVHSHFNEFWWNFLDFLNFELLFFFSNFHGFHQSLLNFPEFSSIRANFTVIREICWTPLIFIINLIYFEFWKLIWKFLAILSNLVFIPLTSSKVPRISWKSMEYFQLKLCISSNSFKFAGLFSIYFKFNKFNEFTKIFLYYHQFTWIFMNFIEFFPFHISFYINLIEF